MPHTFTDFCVETDDFLAEGHVTVTWDHDDDGEIVVESFDFASEGEGYVEIYFDDGETGDGEDIGDDHPRRAEVERVVRAALESQSTLERAVEDDLEAMANDAMEEALGYPDSFEYRGR